MTFPDSNAYPLVPDAKTLKEYGEVAIQKGLTKRELFAAMAMQGLLSDNDYSPYTLRNGDYINTLGEQCVKYADALIAELNKEVQS